MEVYYPGAGHETYHPQLGKLVPNEPFNLDGKIAKQYLDSGLLKKVKEKPATKKVVKLPTGSSPEHGKYEK
jgi:hypothetical protein